MFEAFADVIRWIISAPFILIGWIIIGAIAGELARRFTASTDESFFADLGLGILGAIIGGFVAGIIGVGLPAGGLPLIIANLVVATFGAVILILIKRMLTGNKQAITS